MTQLGWAAVLGLALGAAACRPHPGPEEARRPSSRGATTLSIADRPSGVYEASPFFSDLPRGADPRLPVPPDNPLTRARVELGRRIFFDAALSADGTVACATCHQPDRAFTDGRPVARGVGGRAGRRNVPTLVNRGYGRSFFWDGRASSLEEQVLQPLQSPTEMDASLARVLRTVQSDPRYAPLVRRAFGSEDVTSARVAQALAGFVRTLVAGDAPVDRYVRGDRAALSAAAARGFDLFRGKAGCVLCHTGSRFTDEGFHNTGVAWEDGALADSGRHAVTARSDDLGAFKTPTLREVGRTAPYMHDGSLPTLEDVVAFYDEGGRENPHRDPLLRPLGLTAAERADLGAFLRSLDGRVWGWDEEVSGDRARPPGR